MGGARSALSVGLYVPRSSSGGHEQTGGGAPPVPPLTRTSIPESGVAAFGPTSTGGAGTQASPIAGITVTGSVSTRKRGSAVLVDVGESVRCPAGGSPCQIVVEAESQPNGRAGAAELGRGKAAKKILVGRAALVAPLAKPSG
jgi:hypothetical protein